MNTSRPLDKIYIFISVAFSNHFLSICCVCERAIEPQCVREELCFNEFALFVILMWKHVDFTNERNGLNDSDLLIEAFHLNCLTWRTRKKCDRTNRGKKTNIWKTSVYTTLHLEFAHCNWIGLELNCIHLIYVWQFVVNTCQQILLPWYANQKSGFHQTDCMPFDDGAKTN